MLFGRRSRSKLSACERPAIVIAGFFSAMKNGLRDAGHFLSSDATRRVIALPRYGSEIVSVADCGPSLTTCEYGANVRNV
ncbi:hypothetical protein R8871_05237 [Paraburkholderia graminis C4D1M]|jgi:hypothetical protein|uniref:Uncharacterized protein n=1 Tax=Paraburkholderia graminis (strain ATCC 700544 / DSM 17151 / LMG 18924 / NCIMB 13744 / C4D1M) TaxID=396598 RepID=B1GAG9_PARG4|nr:hypothetical protein BgramDRAFT_6364 [Paraburkholderia graminis C4D1M]CAB3725414.1 hypothetical protein R8871_05237 [Paraburkholderia graminis C4D1M]